MTVAKVAGRSCSMGKSSHASDPDSELNSAGLKLVCMLERKDKESVNQYLEG